MEVLRIPLETFNDLCALLQERGLPKPCLRNKINIQEQLAVFLFIVGQNSSNRGAQ